MTGSSRGIGLAIAKALAEAGTRVGISSRKRPACEEVAASISEKAALERGIYRRSNVIERLLGHLETGAVSQFDTTDTHKERKFEAGRVMLEEVAGALKDACALRAVGSVKIFARLWPLDRPGHKPWCSGEQSIARGNDPNAVDRAGCGAQQRNCCRSHLLHQGGVIILGFRLHLDIGFNHQDEMPFSSINLPLMPASYDIPMGKKFVHFHSPVSKWEHNLVSQPVASCRNARTIDE
nr:SDR family NAD(P)-dependent oxidoreductase [Sphingomonas sp. CDS-1]